MTYNGTTQSLIKTAGLENLPPKVLEALIGAGAGGLAGTLIGGASAALIPSKYDVTSSDFKLDGTPSKRRKFKERYVRDPVGQSIRSGLIGMMIGGTKPFIEQPIRDWLTQRQQS